MFTPIHGATRCTNAHLIEEPIAPLQKMGNGVVIFFKLCSALFLFAALKERQFGLILPAIACYAMSKHQENQTLSIGKMAFWQGVCPHCDETLKVHAKLLNQETTGFDCPTCAKRIAIRNNLFHAMH